MPVAVATSHWWVIRHCHWPDMLASIRWLWPLLFIGHTALGNQAMTRLYDDLLSDYNRLIRPVSNYSQTVLVHLSLKLTQLLDLVRTERARARMEAQKC